MEETEKICGRAVLFLLAGILFGALIGFFNGALVGFLFGTLSKSAGFPTFGPPLIPVAPTPNFVWSTGMASSFITGIYGAISGLSICAVTWPLISFCCGQYEKSADVFMRIIRSTFRVSLLLTFIGALDGMLFQTLYLFCNRDIGFAKIIRYLFEPYEDSWFYKGFIIGCSFGLFIGPIAGARPVQSWLNVPTRELPGELRAGVLRLFGARADE